MQPRLCLARVIVVQRHFWHVLPLPFGRILRGRRRCSHPLPRGLSRQRHGLGVVDVLRALPCWLVRHCRRGACMHAVPGRLVLPRWHRRPRGVPVRKLLRGGQRDDSRLLPVQLRGGLLLELGGLGGLQRHERHLHDVLWRHGLRGRRGAVDALPRRHLLLWRRDVGELLPLPCRPAVRHVRRGRRVLALIKRRIVPSDGLQRALPGLRHPLAWLLAEIWLQQQLPISHRLLWWPRLVFDVQ